MAKSMVKFGTVVLCLGLTVKAEAQIGNLLREGAKAVSRTAGRSAGKATKESVKRAPTMTRVGARGMQRVAPRGAAAASQKVVSRFGKEGQQALQKLSTQGTRQFAEVADDIAKSGHSQKWLQVIAEHGDKAVEWIWERKMAIAVGTAATAVVLAPDEFLAAAEGVGSTIVTTAGQHLLEPLVAESLKHAAQPLAEQAVQAIPWKGICLGGLLIALGCCWRFRRRKR